MYANYIKLIIIPITPTTNPPIPTQRDILDILSFFEALCCKNDADSSAC